MAAGPVIAILFALWVIYALLVEPYAVRVTRIELASPNLPRSFDGLHILQLSDVHSRSVGTRERRVELLVKDLNPDLVVCTGDLLDSGQLRDAPCRWLARLGGAYPPIMAVGNHDVDYPLTSAVSRSYLRARGLTVLVNESTRMERDGDYIEIVGVDDPHAARADLDLAMRQVNHDAFTILLAHSPDINRQIRQGTIDLVLSGHTHGGQVCLPLIGPLRTNVRKTSREWCTGLTRLNERTTLYVSRGVGVSGVPLRFLCPPELVSITLRSAAVDAATNSETAPMAASGTPSPK
ncbi:MAG: metallophosphoesterase [Armatimonadetes bacterium]|nr:metallophosphoesterase [Armatimonadota bacterium]